MKLHQTFLSDPANAETLLLYQDATDIKWMFLNGSEVSTHRKYSSPPHSGILGVDFDHLMNTVCWINHANTSSVMRCANSTDLSNFSDKPQPYLYSFKGEKARLRSLANLGNISSLQCTIDCVTD